MTRTVGSHGPTTAEAIMRVGLRLIYEHSYEAFTLRELAREVGITAGSLYNYIASKQDLLSRLMLGHLEEVLEAAKNSLPSTLSPLEAIETFVDFHLSYHMNKRREVTIAYSELRSLEGKNRNLAVKLREQYEQLLIDRLDAAVECGAITTRHTRVTAYAIIAMLTGISNWYDPRGPLSKSELIALYTDLVLRGLAPTPQSPAADTD